MPQSFWRHLSSAPATKHAAAHARAGAQAAGAARAQHGRRTARTPRTAAQDPCLPRPLSYGGCLTAVGLEEPESPGLELTDVRHHARRHGCWHTHRPRRAPPNLPAPRRARSVPRPCCAPEKRGARGRRTQRTGRGRGVPGRRPVQRDASAAARRTRGVHLLAATAAESAVAQTKGAMAGASSVRGKKHFLEKKKPLLLETYPGVVVQ